MGLDRSSFLHILHVKFPQFELPAASRAHGKLHFFMRAVLFNLNPSRFVLRHFLPTDVVIFQMLHEPTMDHFNRQSSIFCHPMDPDKLSKADYAYRFVNENVHEVIQQAVFLFNL